MNFAEPQTLPHTLAAPGLARRHLTSASASWPAGLLDLAILLTSELVTNAVVHGLGPVQLRAVQDGDRLRIEVSDGKPGPLPGTHERPADVDPSGRGLLIVDRLANRWGYHSRRRPPGKVVWFELQYPPTG